MSSLLPPVALAQPPPSVPSHVPDALIFVLFLGLFALIALFAFYLLSSVSRETWLYKMFSQRSLSAGFCWIWPIGGTKGRLMREPWALFPGSASFLLVATSWRPARVQLLSGEPSSRFCNDTSSLFPEGIIVYRKSDGILKKQLELRV